MQMQTISRNPDAATHRGAANVSEANQWVTSGTYKVAQIYDPDYQRAFTRNDLPASLSYSPD
jgi:hypothetical protein